MPRSSRTLEIGALPIEQPIYWHSLVKGCAEQGNERASGGTDGALWGTDDICLLWKNVQLSMENTEADRILVQ
ncbi:unnamed protein product [Cylicocyclus nassatus]|uniref:Uncharacterized protein n=1 Tax=Cylicocyclus nassatus TaxID=53992 RepID=A0AA36H8K5_CYLNA|nr:unnamed protein product [Cylicocyclus nassatus]